jgi:branched-chain amino acid transport system permease protein
MGQILINGLMIGGVYALVAVGVTMIFGVMKIVNFAQGEFLMVGMYISWIVYSQMDPSMSLYWLIIPIACIMFFFGIIVFKLVIKPAVGSTGSNFIVLTFGLSYLLQNLLQLIFGSTYRSMPVNNELKLGAFNVGNLILMKPKLFAFFIALAFVAFVFWFLNKTDYGRGMRATAESMEISKTLGINTGRMYLLAFGIGTIFAGVSGLLLTPVYLIYPRIGTLFSTKATCCVVLGGLGNITGALISGLIIGMVESVVGTTVSLELADVAINLVLIAVLIFRPYGIFGGRARKA